MRRNRTGSQTTATMVGALLLWALTARATVVGPPPWCAADCNGDGFVAIDEIIVCVNILLGGSPAGSCPACDGDGDGIITVAHLAQSVLHAIVPDCAVADSCGDGRVDGSETCDDGNDGGGDGCAANCTVESARSGTAELLLPGLSRWSPIQLAPIHGEVLLRTGQPRATASGEFSAGDIPVALRVDDWHVAPYVIPAIACVSPRVAPLSGSAAGLGGSGAIHCGADGGGDVDYRLVQDHNTTPGDRHNRERGTPDDPECDDSATWPEGERSHACREGSADPCPTWAD